MIVFAVKNATESSDKLILRYKKMFFQTRTLNRMKNNMQEQRDPSKRRYRERAIVREAYRTINRNLAN